MTASSLAKSTIATTKSPQEQHQEQLQLLQQRIDELRVAYQEVTTVVVAQTKKKHQNSSTGPKTISDEKNNVYIQLSSGAVAMCSTDRNVVEARISRKLQNAREEYDALQLQE